MDFKIASCSTAGVQKKVNQDAFMMEEAVTSQGKVLLAVVCDGMGGYQNGELASAQVVRSFQTWFHETLPTLTVNKIDINEVRNTWDKLVYFENEKISRYGLLHNSNIGTTVTAVFITEEFFLIMNIGNSRSYLITNKIYQITKDHVENANKNGNPDAGDDSGKKYLTQCIGASKNIVPDYFSGRTERKISLLLCTDGFSNTIRNEEILELLNSGVNPIEFSMQHSLETVTQMAVERGEADDITAMLIQIN